MKKEKTLARTKNLDDIKNLPTIKLSNENLPPYEKLEPVLDALRKDTGAMLYLYGRLTTLGILIYENNSVKGANTI